MMQRYMVVFHTIEAMNLLEILSTVIHDFRIIRQIGRSVLVDVPVYDEQVFWDMLEPEACTVERNHTYTVQ